MAIDVATRPSAKTGHHHVLETVHCDGASVLWLEDEDYAPEPGEKPRMETLDLDEFEQQLSEQMLVPPHLLKINYASFKPNGRETIAFPRGWTARKR